MRHLCQSADANSVNLMMFNDADVKHLAMISHFWHHVLSSGYVSNNRKSNKDIWLECKRLINSILRNKLKDWMTRLKWKLLKILLFTVHKGSPRKSQIIHIFESRSPQGFMRVTWKLFQSSSPRLHSYLIIHIVLRTLKGLCHVCLIQYAGN